MADEPIKVFYSWQSWTSRKTNWNFIQEAIEIAIKRIKAEPEIEIVPVLDRDTQGEAGSVDIADTIFRKIDNCQIFICDVTFVTKPRSPHRIPNPNVLIELGYAAKSIGWENIICVVNEAHGIVKDMPFDLRQRRLLKYTLPENSDDLAEVRRQLANGIYSAIKVILEKIQRVVPSISRNEKLKQLIPDPIRQIELEDLLRDTSENAQSTFTSADFYEARKALLNQPDADREKLWSDCFQLYFSILENALTVFTTLSWYGNSAHTPSIRYALNRWIAMPQSDERHSQWRYIPFALLLYVCGISAIYRQNWHYLREAMFNTTTQHPNEFGYPMVSALKLIAKELFLQFHRTIPGGRQTYVGKHINTLIRPLFSKLIPADDDFRRTFDLFEMILGLCYLTMHDDSLGGPWIPPHESLRNGFSWAYIFDFWKQRGQNSDKWEFLDNNYLSSPEDVIKVLTQYQQISVQYYRSIWTSGSILDYVSAYIEGLGRNG